MNKYIKKDVTVKLLYTKAWNEKNTYYGYVKEPKYTKELAIDVYNDGIFDPETETWEDNGKITVELSGTNRALKQLGIYLINLSMYKTPDPDYHEHFDNLLTTEGESIINLIIHKGKSK